MDLSYSISNLILSKQFMTARIAVHWEMGD